MIKIKQYRMIASLVTYLLIFAITIVSLYAYFVIEEEHGITITTGEYGIEVIISFNDIPIDGTSPYYDQEKDIVIINAYDELSDNYIGDFKIDIVITSKVASRVRLKLQDEWELTRIYLDQDPNYPIDPVVLNVYHEAKDQTYYPFSLFKVDPTFNALYDLEGYTYINQIIPKNETTIINFISGGDAYPIKNNEVFYEMVYVHVDLIVDIVQANRFVEKWGIDPAFYN